MSIPKEHQKLLSQNDYQLKCSPIIFNEEEREVLNEFGYWLSALASGSVKPFTPEQRLFVLVANGKAEPKTPFEKVWTKYQKRQLWEKENKDIPRYTWVDPGEVFFSREDINKMNPYYRG